MADTRRLPAPQVAYWDWQLNAACRGMASTTFFHPPAERGDERQARIQNAKEVCRTCPVIDQCLAHAQRIPEPYGIWGGLSEDERAQRLGVQSLRYPAPFSPTTTNRAPNDRNPAPKDTTSLTSLTS